MSGPLVRFEDVRGRTSLPKSGSFHFLPRQDVCSSFRGPLWGDQAKRGKEFAKIVGISGEQPLIAQGKCSDENIGNGAPGCLVIATLLNMPSPCLTGVHGIFRQPVFLMVNSEL
jgi:hypothetical protein